MHRAFFMGNINSEKTRSHGIAGILSGAAHKRMGGQNVSARGQMMSGKQFWFRQKYRFDLGQSLLSLLSFGLMVVAAGDKLSTLFQVNTRTLLVIIVPGGLAGVWLVGYLMDRMEFAQCYNREANERNENWERLFSELRSMSLRAAREEEKKV
jgi:hypothetical protein